MNTMQRIEFMSECIATVSDTACNIREQQNALSRALVGDNTVLRTSPGLYLTYKTNTDGTRSYQPTCITRAVRWTPEAAQRVADSLPKSEHWNPTPVSLHEALATELESCEKTLAQFVEFREQLHALNQE